ncbi:MAG: hypothetical protein AAF798_22175 [Bacteroidota bacterium]
MKLAVPFFALFLLAIIGCTPSTDRTLPEDEDVRPVFLGFQMIESSSLEFMPYLNRSQLTYRDASGNSFVFFAKEPVYLDFFTNTEVFPDPTNEFEEAHYNYNADKYRLEFLSAATGILLQFELFPSICDDPKLEDEDVLIDQLEVSVRGFLSSGQNSIPVPLMTFATATQVICSDDPNVSKRRFPEIELIEETFEDVLYVSHDLGESTFEVFYNKQWGLVAFRYQDIFWVLDKTQ